MQLLHLWRQTFKRRVVSKRKKFRPPTVIANGAQKEKNFQAPRCEQAEEVYILCTDEDRQLLLPMGRKKKLKDTESTFILTVIASPLSL